MATHTSTGVHGARTPDLDGAFFREHGFTESPVVVQCYLTLRCDLACPHCLAARDDAAAEDMPLDLFDRLCGELASMGVPELLLTGGEPLRHGRFGDVVDCMRRHAVAWSLNTAVCPDAGQQVAIRRYPPGFVAVSLDGPAAVHDAFRGRVGAYEGAMAALRFFAGVPDTVVCAGTTVTTRNLPYLEETFRAVRTSGAHRWGLHLLLPEGRAGARRSLFPNAKQMRRLLRTIVEKRREFPVSLCDEMGHAGEWEGLVRDEAFFCAAGRAMCAVLPDGSVMPCSTLDPRHCEGRLADDTLANIWRTGFGRQRNPPREGKCAACADWAACGSGCWLQRQHGTQCFRHLWRVPPSLKVAAGVGLCLGAVGIHGAPAPAESNSVPPGAGSVPLMIPGVYGSKAFRGSELRRWWLGPESEAAVRRALEWFKTRQSGDGSWPGREPEAATALVLLCYGAHGDWPATSEPYGPCVQQAIKHLYQGQAADGRFSDDPVVHALCVLALSESYLFTRMPSLRDAVNRGAQCIVKSQLPCGGWGAKGGPPGAWDLTSTAAQIHALRIADIVAPDLDEIPEAFGKAADFLLKTAFRDGAFRSSAAPEDQKAIRPADQAIGLRSLRALSYSERPEVAAASRWLEQHRDRPFSGPGEGGLVPLLARYYEAQTYWDEGMHPTNWASRIAAGIVASQEPGGNWKTAKPGTGPENGVAEDADGVVLTAVQTLILEVPARGLLSHRPMFRPVKLREEPPRDAVIEKI